MAPDEQSAVINVYRPAKLIAEVPFSLWSREGYAGSLRGGQYMQLRVALSRLSGTMDRVASFGLSLNSQVQSTLRMA